MARITIQDCLEQVSNPFELVMLASKRARDLTLGKEVSELGTAHKPTIIALQEIANGSVTPEVLQK